MVNVARCLMFVSIGLPVAVAIDAPFGNFKVGDTKEIRRARLQLTNRAERKYRTILRKAWSEEPNFAGHYVVAEWGCGTECTMMAIIDLATGRVYAPPLGGSFSEERWYVPFNPKDYRDAKYRVDSKLMVLPQVCPEKATTCGDKQFVWEANRWCELRNNPD